MCIIPFNPLLKLANEAGTGFIPLFEMGELSVRWFGEKDGSPLPQGSLEAKLPLP